MWGERGERGIPGKKGEVGLKGRQGSVGVIGDRGRVGNAGQTGDPGMSGLQGSPGSEGNQGLTGYVGEKGIPGAPGLKGVGGITGEFGPPGPPGQALGFQRFSQHDDLDQAIRNIKSLLYVSSTVEKYKFPLGTRDNPAMSCKHLMDSDSYRDGHFWIDPNLGCPADAIKVYCNFTAGGESCVSPLKDKIPKKTWKNDSKSSWQRFSNLKQGFKISYRVSKVQLNFLRLLSTTVSQTVTVKCKRIVPWFHRASKSHRYSWIFHGRRGFDFTPTSNPRPNVTRDYCQRDDGKWRRTEFKFETNKVDVLPIEDWTFFHRAVGKEQFGVKIGQVCYR